MTEDNNQIHKRKTDINTWIYRPRVEFLIVFLLLCIGIFIRAYHFGIVPVGVHQDEAMAAVDAKALADYGTDRFGIKYPVHFTAWGNSQMSVLLSYCMIPFIKLFGFSTISIRLPMLIISCFGLLALYFFAKKAGGVKLGIVILILGIIAPWHYMQSRWSFDCNAFPHFFLFAVCMLVAGVKKRRYLYFSMILFALCSYCYGIANYSVPLFLLAMAIYLVQNQIIKMKEVGICIGVYFLVALPEYLSMLITVLGLPSIETPIFTIPSFLNSTRSSDILFANFSWEQLKTNLIWTFTTVFSNRDKSVPNTIVKYGPVYYVTIFFFAIGLISVIKRCRKKISAMEKLPYIIMLNWLFMGIWVGIVTRAVTVHRINIIFYAILIIAGVGIDVCIKKYRYLLLPIATMYGALAIMFSISYFGSWAEISRIYYYESYINALEYAETLNCDAYYITPDPQGVGVNLVGEILTLYCHEIDAPYYQGQTNVQAGVERLPFAERYHFQDVSEEIVKNNEGKSVVYIIDGSSILLFPEDEYCIDSFYDDYYVVYKNK